MDGGGGGGSKHFTVLALQLSGRSDRHTNTTPAKVIGESKEYHAIMVSNLSVKDFAQ